MNNYFSKTFFIRNDGGDDFVDNDSFHLQSIVMFLHIAYHWWKIQKPSISWYSFLLLSIIFYDLSYIMIGLDDL